MNKTLLIPIAVGLALAGCNKSTRSTSTAANDAARNPDYSSSATSSTTPAPATTTTATTRTNDFAADVNAAGKRAGDAMSDAAHSTSAAMSNAAHSVATTARITEWKLSGSEIQADLDGNREIVRTKDSAGAPTGSMDKSVVESMVKGRLQADGELAALKLDADADKTGAVTLKGKAHSADEVGRAIALALDTEGVNKVTSKIKLDKDAKTTIR